MTVLADLMPSVALSVHREHDPDAVWDGEGPDPVEIGYNPYVVVVRAITVMKGEIVEGSAHLCSSYYKPDEDIGMVHGYLPQMIGEALQELWNNVPDAAVKTSIKVSIDFMTGVLHGMHQQQEQEEKA